jgi:serine phosphatase RsbU (regulator of sigma subunit)
MSERNDAARDDGSRDVAAGDVAARDDAALLRLARERAAYLTEAGRRVSGSLHLADTQRRALAVVVPQLADWAQLTLRMRTRMRYVSLRTGDLAPLEMELDASAPAPAGAARSRVPPTGRPPTGRPALLEFPDEGGAGSGALNDLVPSVELRDQLATIRPGTVLAVPLIAQGSTIGSLALARSAGRGFGSEDVALVEEIADRIALAVDAARRYTERSEVAAILQASLRPPKLRRMGSTQLASRYRPSSDELEIGGDFFDVWGTDDDWSLVLGDVSGKGVEAAVVTGQARHTVRGAAYVDRRPAPVLQALNALLTDIGATRFVTAVYARVRPVDPDRSGGLLVEIASAGHPPPLVVRADGTVETLTVRGLVAGMVPDVEYESQTIHLRPDDTLLLYTDGVTEAGDHSVRLGTMRLIELAGRYAAAGIESMVTAIEQDAVERAGAVQRDDLAVLAVRATR